MQPSSNSPVVVRLATANDRRSIYQLRHSVFAAELRQHSVNEEERLTDDLDQCNTYILCESAQRLLGFISITPPTAPRFAIEKYFPRSTLSFEVEGTHELRLLTISPEARGMGLSAVLLYAAFRWIEAHGAQRIVATGHSWTKKHYCALGMRPTNLAAQSGALYLELLTASPSEVKNACASRIAVIRSFVEAGMVKWAMPVSMDFDADQMREAA